MAPDTMLNAEGYLDFNSKMNSNLCLVYKLATCHHEIKYHRKKSKEISFSVERNIEASSQ